MVGVVVVICKSDTKLSFLSSSHMLPGENEEIGGVFRSHCSVVNNDSCRTGIHFLIILRKKGEVTYLPPVAT